MQFYELGVGKGLRVSLNVEKTKAIEQKRRQRIKQEKKKGQSS